MKKILYQFLILILPLAAHAELKLPAIISDHMVLQQKQANTIWGWDDAGAKVTVSFAGQAKTTEAGADGRWTVALDPVPANSEPQSLTVEGSSKREITDVLVGEVWMCSGQSNMGFTLSQDWNGDLEAAASTLPNLRLIRVPLVGTQEPQKDFKGEWKTSSAASALPFTAVGFLYGRYLHEILHVPVGLIDNSWGGSAAEAWVRRESLEKDDRFQLLMSNTRNQEAAAGTDEAKAKLEAAVAKWTIDVEKAKTEGRNPPSKPRSTEEWLRGNARPGNIFNGMVLPTLPYGLKGIIWYQGESNAGRAYEYASLFPFMIEEWRKEAQQPDLAFYWVQLADYLAEKPTPGESAWAELRESQTKTMKLPHTGQAVIIDLGEGKDIHPRNKHDVAARLVRWPLAQDYGMKFPYRSPEFKSVTMEGNRATVKIDCFGSKLRPFDVVEALGFSICGEDKVWKAAKGKIVGPDTVEVTSEEVAAPVAVRYAWADNPVCNLFSDVGLPVTPFRTDDFRMTTRPAAPAPAVAPSPAVAPAAPAPAAPAPAPIVPLPPTAPLPLPAPGTPAPVSSAPVPPASAPLPPSSIPQ